MTDYKRIYMRGYNAGSRTAWPEHKPPAPPEAVIAELIETGRALRDRLDTLLSQGYFEEGSERRSMDAEVEAFDKAMGNLSRWLKEE